MRYLPLIVIAAAIVLFFATGLQDRLSFDALRTERAALDAFVAGNRFAAAALYFGLLVLLVVLSLPVSFVMSVIGGYLFGPVLATPLVLAAITIGSTLFLLLTRGALGDLMRARVGDRLAGLERGFRADAFNYLLAVRLAPVAPVYLTNLAVGLVGMKLRDFVLATLLGLLPVTIVFTLVGNGLRAALDAGLDADPVSAAQRLLLSPEVLAPILGLIALALAPVAWRRLRRI